MYTSKVYFTTIKPELGPSQTLDLEPLSHELDSFDYESIVFQSLVNEGKHQMVLNSKRSQYYYDEKQLRDAAAAEVAHVSILHDEGGKIISRKRKGMDVVEKVQDSRDRNREHAKNTRLRKKAYVIKLKELAEQLERQKINDEIEKKVSAMKICQTDATRRNVVRLFLSYRESNIQDKSTWEAIVEDNFVFTLPITPYRSFLKRDVISGSRVLVGINALIADTASLSLMVESVGQGSCQWKESMKRGVSCRVVYGINQQDFHCAGDVVMCRYIMRTEGFQEVGAFSRCEQYGMLLCRFSESNKLASVEMVFDVMGFMQQLQRATVITPETSVIPNTVDMAMQGSKEARAIMRSDPPFPVLHINAAWTELSGVQQHEAEGVPLSEVLRLLPSQFEHFYDLIANCIEGQAGSAVLITQCPFTPEQPALVYLKMFPLTSSTETTVTHFLGIHTDLPLSVLEKKTLLAHCKAATANSTSTNMPIPVPLSLLNSISLPTFQQAAPMPLPLFFNPDSNRFVDNDEKMKIGNNNNNQNIINNNNNTSYRNNSNNNHLTQHGVQHHNLHTMSSTSTKSNNTKSNNTNTTHKTSSSNNATTNNNNTTNGTKLHKSMMSKGLQMTDLPSNFKGISYNLNINNDTGGVENVNASSYFNTNEQCQHVGSNVNADNGHNNNNNNTDMMMMNSVNNRRGCDNNGDNENSSCGDSNGSDSCDDNNNNNKSFDNNNNNNSNNNNSTPPLPPVAPAEPMNKRFKSDRTGVNGPRP